MKRKLKNVFNHYIETGLLNSYETTDIINNGDISLFEDTQLIEQNGAIFLERKMDAGGRRFAVCSAFGKESNGNPTEKLLSLIDKSG